MRTGERTLRLLGKFCLGYAAYHRTAPRPSRPLPVWRTSILRDVIEALESDGVDTTHFRSLLNDGRVTLSVATRAGAGGVYAPKYDTWGGGGYQIPAADLKPSGQVDEAERDKVAHELFHAYLDHVMTGSLTDPALSTAAEGQILIVRRTPLLLNNIGRGGNWSSTMTPYEFVDELGGNWVQQKFISAIQLIMASAVDARDAMDRFDAIFTNPSMLRVDMVQPYVLRDTTVDIDTAYARRIAAVFGFDCTCTPGTPHACPAFRRFQSVLGHRPPAPDLLSLRGELEFVAAVTPILEDAARPENAAQMEQLVRTWVQAHMNLTTGETVPLSKLRGLLLSTIGEIEARTGVRLPLLRQQVVRIVATLPAGS